MCDWFRLGLVDFRFGSALKLGLKNLISIEILIKFPLNPHPKYTGCLLILDAKPDLVVKVMPEQ